MNELNLSLDEMSTRSAAFWATFAPKAPVGAALAARIDWDELDSVLVIGVDSEGARRIYASSGDYRDQQWLARQLQVYLDDAIRAAASDCE